MTDKPMTKDEVLAVLDRLLCEVPMGIGHIQLINEARATIAAWNVSPSADVAVAWRVDSPYGVGYRFAPELFNAGFGFCVPPEQRITEDVIAHPLTEPPAPWLSDEQCDAVYEAVVDMLAFRQRPPQKASKRKAIRAALSQLAQQGGESK